MAVAVCLSCRLKKNRPQNKHNPPSPPARIGCKESDLCCGPKNRDRQKGKLPHHEAFFRHPPPHIRLRHPNHSGTPRPQGRENHYDLHPYPAELGGPGYRQPGGLALRPWGRARMSTLTTLMLSTVSRTLTSGVKTYSCYSFEVDLGMVETTKGKSRPTRISNVSRISRSIANQS